MRTLEQVLREHGPLPIFNNDGTYAEVEENQKADAIRLAEWGCGIGDLPVGYGKTLIATLVALMREPDLAVVLVPPVLVAQWVEWINSIPHCTKATAYNGSPKQRQAIDLAKVDWLVLPYGIFRNDFERLQKAFKDRSLIVIMDEAQNLKNSQSKLFKFVRQVADGKDLLLMSGTLMSGPEDAYAYIKLTNPPAYRTLTHFRNVHVAEYDFFNQPKKWHNLELMQDNLSARRVFRTKEQVHSALPKARWIPVYYDLPKEHMKLYRRLMEEQLLLLEDGSKIDATTAQRLYHAAQQIITNWPYFSGDPTKRSVVFDLLDELCDEINLGFPGDQDLGLIPSSKLMLWTQYTRSSALVHQYLQAKADELAKKHGRPLRATAAYGGVNSVRNIAQFMKDPDTVGLAAHPKSAGAGLNPQRFCWEMGFIETPTRTIDFVQSAGRIDRKGQRFNPNIRIYVARNTVQEGLLRNLMSNDDLVSSVTGANSIRKMIFPD